MNFENKKLILPIAILLIAAIVIFSYSAYMQPNEQSKQKTATHHTKRVATKSKNIPKTHPNKTIQSVKTTEQLKKTIIEGYANIQFGAFSSCCTAKNQKTYQTVSPPPSPVLALIAGVDENQKNFAKRQLEADALPNNLNSASVEFLLGFLHKQPRHDKLKPLELNSVKNEVVLALMRQKHFPPTLIHHLIGMYYSPLSDSVWRDYCIQFIHQNYKHIELEEYRKLAKNTLFDALEYKNNIAGTAIIGLASLANEKQFSKKEIADAAFKLLADSNVPYSVKIPALHVAAKFKHPEALNHARKILAPKSNATVPMKMAAISVLASNGNKQDLDTINPFLNSADSRLSYAATSAMNKSRRQKR